MKFLKNTLGYQSNNKYASYLLIYSAISCCVMLAVGSLGLFINFKVETKQRRLDIINKNRYDLVDSDALDIADRDRQTESAKDVTYPYSPKL